MSSLQHHETKSIAHHLGELRTKLFIALGAFIVCTIIAHFFHARIIAFLLRPIGDQHLIFLSPLEPLFFIIKIDSIAGIILSFPVIVWCFFSYITPAFPKRIASLVLFFYVTSTLLVMGALVYAFGVTIPLSLKFLYSITIPGIQNSFSVESYLNFFIAQALIIMAIFQLPIVIIGGIYIGAFKATVLAQKRRFIYLIVTIALAVLTPTTDIFSLCIVLVPCFIIFEVSLIGGRIVEYLRKRKKKNATPSS